MELVDFVTVLQRLLVAAALGALIGLERQLRTQPAGLRTQLLVALGAALFTIAGAETAGADKTRIAAQVVSGIGFLGAGAILRDVGNIRGVTTAASLWVTAAVGVTVGLGDERAAAVATAATLVALTVLRGAERLLPGRRRERIVLELDRARPLRVTLDAVRALLGEVSIKHVQSAAPGTYRVTVQVALPRETSVAALVDQVDGIDGVLGVEMSGP